MPTSSDTDEILLAWQRAEQPGAVEFVVTEGYADEVLALLAAGEVTARRSPAAFRTGAGDLVATVVAVADNPAAWVALGVVVKAFLDRHKGKRIKVDERGRIEAGNYSARDLERIMRALARADEPGDGAEGSPR